MPVFDYPYDGDQLIACPWDGNGARQITRSQCFKFREDTVINESLRCQNCVVGRKTFSLLSPKPEAYMEIVVPKIKKWLPGEQEWAREVSDRIRRREGLRLKDLDAQLGCCATFFIKWINGERNYGGRTREKIIAWLQGRGHVFQAARDTAESGLSDADISETVYRRRRPSTPYRRLHG